jgi:hypothetical protein
MSFLTGLFLPGKRTFTLSIVAGILAVLIQADTQGVLTLSPMIRLMFNMGLALVIPMIPIYLRKGINNALNDGAK